MGQFRDRILAVGTECPNDPKSRDTEQHNILNHKCAGAKSVGQGMLGNENQDMVQSQRVPSEELEGQRNQLLSEKHPGCTGLAGTG